MSSHFLYMEEEIAKAINLQRAFIQINEEESIKFIDDLLSSSYVEEKSNVDRFIYIIYASLLAKPQYHQNYIKYLVRLIPNLQKLYTVDELLSSIPKYQLFANKYIATIMIKNNLFTIEQYREKYPNKYIDFDMVDLNQKEQSLYTSIKNDDIVSFQTIVSHSNLDINQKLEYNENDFFYPEANIPWNMTYIVEFVVYCGSLKIFKYLYGHNVNLDLKKLLYYAFSGGNYEIIHLIEENKYEYDKNDLALTAIKHHSNEFINYLIDNYSISVNDNKCIVSCVESNNIEILQQILEDEYSNYPDLIQCAVLSSVRKGNLDALKYLADVKKVNLSDKIYYNGATLFKTAVQNYNIEMIKYIYDKIGDNINCCDDILMFYSFR